jgi:predicted ATPase/class 3 adenylate cyclase
MPPTYEVEEGGNVMSTRPTGTITFLFTDIEGSTQLWEQQPDAMKPALERHDHLLREAIESNGGYLFSTGGDAFCAAFAEPTDALETALSAQRALQTEQWPSEIGALRVRMAIHTGIAEEREGDYFGPPLNRVARLLAAGHGGQTLISTATQELIRDALPAKSSLLDLGEHRLKDVFRPERVYQVNAPGLPAEFPALRTLDAKHTNLPAQPTPFIGREREIAAVLALLRREDARLVTLTGAGGTGKTRLSLQVAADLLDEYEHGVWFIELAAISDPDLVIPTIASTLGVKEQSTTPIMETLTGYLQKRQLLLVLDNFEQVVKAAPHIGDLLAGAPKIKIISSSREVLRLRGEHDYAVQPLGLPNLKRKETLAVVSQYEAVALFIQRAKAASDRWEISDENAPAVAEICVKLDGLPLAIELAAARSRMLRPEAMLEKLKDRLGTLTGGARDLPARQQTIRNTIDWSYDLLDAGEKTLFARLGVFVGGWTVEAAEAVCDLTPRPPLRSAEEGESGGGSGEGEGAHTGAPLQIDVLSGLESLLDKSLIHPEEGASGETRFAMLETIREYAAEKLAQGGEIEAIRDAYIACFVAMAEEAEPYLKAGGQEEWFPRLVNDFGNIQAAIDLALNVNTAESAARIVVALWRFWIFWERITDYSRTLERIIEHAAHLSTDWKGRVYLALSKASNWLNNYPAQLTQVETALGFFRQGSNQTDLADGLTVLGSALGMLGRNEEALAVLEESVTIKRAIGDEVGAASSLRIALDTHWSIHGNAEHVLPQYQEVLNLFNKAKNVVGSILVLDLMSGILYFEHRYEEAHSHVQEALDMARSIQSSLQISYSLRTLAMITSRQGNIPHARHHLTEAVTLLRNTNSQELWALLFSMSVLHIVSGHPRHAAMLLAADDVYYPDLMIRPIIEQREVAEIIASAKSALGDAAFEKAWAQGQKMTLDEAVEFALQEGES